jgi:hypothetical protein
MRKPDFEKNFKTSGIIIGEKELRILSNSQAIPNLPNEALKMFLSATKAGHSKRIWRASQSAS